MLYLGLMSGTSANGIDGGLVDIGVHGFSLCSTHTQNYSPGVKEAIEAAIQQYADIDKEDIERLDEALAVDFAQAAKTLIGKLDEGIAITAVGSHGQTIYHGPGDDPPVSVQVGDPQTIADLTGLVTVADFRSADLRAGGQGAPLAPAFHNAMFRNEGVDRVIVNIGGIANLTHLPADPDRAVTGFDTGPGNTLMDLWCRARGNRAYDLDGAWAQQGHAREDFVKALLEDPYFSAPPPKSTGREYFHLDWMTKRYPCATRLEPADIQAGLLEVTARSIARSAIQTCGAASYEMYVCGGGARNGALMKRLGTLVPAPVGTTEVLGLAPEWVEVCAFAWLAHRRIHGLPGNLPSVTGASREVLLGEVYTPSSAPDS